MRVKSALAALAGGVLLLAALACETEAPPTDIPPTTAPVPAATAAPRSAPVAAATPSPIPTATARPTPVPTATPLPEGVGICYRTPEVQEWIIRQLQIPACRLITEPELYRIDEALYVPDQLKAGDLAGLVNVPRVDIDYGHCGDWENPDYAAAILGGLNRDAQIRFNVVMEVGYDGGLAKGGGVDPSWPPERKREFSERQFREALTLLIYPYHDDSRPVFVSVDDLVNAGWNQTFSIADLQTFPARARQTREEMNRRARSIAQAIRAAGFGKGGAVKLQAPGQAVVISRDLPAPKPTRGWQWSPGASTPVAVEVVVSIKQPSHYPADGMPECREE